MQRGERHMTKNGEDLKDVIGKMEEEEELMFQNGAFEVDGGGGKI